jgi:7-carboxy-7-deazaguanine synthase
MYFVKEIFYTLQGEGANAGRPAVFLRFSGCNLWNGLETGRAKGAGSCSQWCDTDFVGTDGTGGGKFSSAKGLAQNVAGACPASRFVVCTGGEPLLQLDDALVAALRAEDFEVAVETNGTLEGPEVDWRCVSPKAGTAAKHLYGDELKLVYPQFGIDPANYLGLPFKHFRLQPKDGRDKQKNTEAALRYCLSHPRWRLSLQTHKLIGIR